MIYLYYGEHVTKSRNEFLELKKSIQGKEYRELEGKNLSEDELVQACTSESLFTNDKVVIIEHLLSSNSKKPKKLEIFLSILIKYKDEITVLLWEDKKLSKTILSKVEKISSVKHFPLPTMLFQMLDSLSPEKKGYFISLYQQIIATEPPEVIHVLLVRRIRQLITIKSGIIPPGMQSWQISRLTNQTRLFTMEQLQVGYKNLLEIELSIKTGTAILGLPEATELAVAQL